MNTAFIIDSNLMVQSVNGQWVPASGLISGLLRLKQTLGAIFYVHGNHPYLNWITTVLKNEGIDLLEWSTQNIISDSYRWIGIGGIDIQGLNEQYPFSAGWGEGVESVLMPIRMATINRKTKETDVSVNLNLDGSGKGTIQTGIHFFDHMLEQLAKHSQVDLQISVNGDLEVDEHHTIEDTAIALGDAFYQALGSKKGIERYGFCLPMDDVQVMVTLDFGGRNWLVWEVEFKREMIGQMPTEMFSHFFKSFSDSAKCNLHIRATGTNEHHKIEGIFKAFAKAIKQAIYRNPTNMSVPSTKGWLE